MSESLNFGILADTVLTLHFLFVLFLLAGLLLIITGYYLHWQWIRNPWYRWAHLVGTVVVAVQAWIGMICPVTSLEMWLRDQAGGNTYTGSFIAHWVSELLYYDLPAWIFILAYSVFAILVGVCWFQVRPGRF